MAQNHEHKHEKGSNIKIAFFLNIGFTLFEIVGGIWTNSMAILSDALHDLGDSFSLGMAWWMEKYSKRKGDQVFSFGYRRFSLLGALINSLILIGGGIFILYKAVGRIIAPEPANARGMILFAIIGVAVNGYAAWRVRKGKSLNERVVSWHLVEDVLGWCAVLIVAVVLLFKDIHYLDPALSIVITIYVLWNVVKRLRETFLIFLQGVPKEIDLEAVVNEISQLDHVQSLHHTHIWTLDGEHHVFTTHIKLENIKSFSEIIETKKRVKALLTRYPFSHYTVETELDEESCELKD